MATRKDAIPGMEIHDGQPEIEPVSQDADLQSLVASEAFMNEQVLDNVHPTTDENQPGHVIVNCNGVNQVLIRGIPTWVKRKYLEVLARMKETKYRQETPNPAAPDQIEMHARTALVYPFELLEDNNPKGRAWLQHVLAEPA